ncbi:response regulator [Gluconobacter wancherniae]|uniref:histidine kinase n=1 Tax=Gluconobacter wancherniae NBRC 103581 TaxID=656744 RepID=A0A511B1I8_9PROT|nr:response regulator [Gluconobacter wancherniae]GBD56908.1 hybrid sensor histidine kinase/response regulator [Gluconobacter wancherniae NBRC 103581]GBR64805.1 two component hybrid sensor histidine kinase and regulator [Gluconobacter wancherniae NBRC 103581]GEK94325.1 hypothetical protein GWA01_20950 [Gluconobacter wancherniae NBRC 103581]
MIWNSAEERPSILLVDDEEEILVALTDLLEDQYDILSTTDPLHALEILRAHPDIATIISDQRMPGLTGDQLLAKARTFSDARSILLTGYADLDAVVSALNQGQVQAYVHKPWDSDALRPLVGEVTQHCLAQRALRTEQALLRGLMEALPIGLVFSDAQGRCIRSNVRNRAEVAGEDELTHYPRQLRSRIREMREEVARQGHDEQIVAEEIPDVDGKGGVQTRWHEVTRLALAWPQGAPSSEAWQVCMDRDVTGRVLMESRLRQADKLQSLGTLAGGIAHDFNNLLAAISGSLELLEDVTDFDETGRNLLKNAVDSAQRGAVLTRRLLQFGRPREARLAPVKIDGLLHDLRDLLAQSLKRRDGGAGKEKLACALCVKDMPENVPDIWSDPDQLEMALLNLCVNARDAMPHGGHVTIEARVVPQRMKDLPVQCSSSVAVALDVIDQGEGMSPEVMKRIFDPFFTTKEVGRGTGLGLSGVYGFVNRSYGEVLVESTPGKGTRMTLVLPAALQSAPPAVNPRKIEERSAANSTQAQKILVVDDEDPVRLVTEGFLKLEGHDVAGASSLEEALASVDERGAFDVAVIDVRMPGHDGVACAEALRQILPTLKILFVSGHTGDVLARGLADALPKPFTQESLRLALARLD